MHWLVKAAIQGGLSCLPASQRWNYWFQRHFGSLSPTPAYIIEKLQLCNQQLSHWHQFGPDSGSPESVLELGTGWLPIVPLGMRLCGIERVITVDVQRLSNPALFNELLKALTSMPFPEIARALPEAHEARFDQMTRLVNQSNPVSLSQLGITSIVGDARHLTLESGELDVVVSNNTLEHIPEGIIEGIFRESHRVLKPSGMMSHLIDMQDHYSYFDSRLSVYHFLQHEELKWRIVNNKLQYQNRLRVSDYRRLHEATNFEILQEQTNAGSPAIVESLDVADAFQSYTTADLAAVQSWMVSRPMPAPAAPLAAG